MAPLAAQLQTRPRRRFVWLTGFAWSTLSLAQTPAIPDLTKASLEDLMNIQVTSVSKKEQRLSNAGAAVFVIAEEDIRRSGATNIPDLLRMVPGVQVARIDANAWAISIRGFNTRYSNKVLVLIDGRSVYSPSFSGVFWDQQAVPLEDIERIEVIRGPGAAVWGANAVNGVINIITKSAKATEGGLLRAGTGTVDNASGLLRYGGTAGNSGSYRVFGQYSRIADGVLANERQGVDGWRRLNGGFRSDWDLGARDSLTVEGNVFSNSEGQTRWPGFSAVLPLEDAFSDTITARGGDLLGRWNHTLQGGSDMSLQVYADAYRRVDLGVPETHKALDIDFQHHVTWGSRNDIVWGLGYRTTHSGLASQDISPVPGGRTDSLYSAFVQDEIRITDALRFTAGSKFEHNAYTGFEYEPMLGLTWALNSRQAIWSSASRAIRQPALTDASLDAVIGDIPLPGGLVERVVLRGNPSVKAEQLRDYEAGYRAQLNKRVSVDIAFFASFYRRLETVEDPVTFALPDRQSGVLLVPLTFDNKAHAKNLGSELSATWNVTSRWRLSPGYSFLRFQCQPDPGSTDHGGDVFRGDGPRHMFQVRSLFNLSKNLDFDNSLYYVSRLPDGDIPARARLDSRIAWRAGEFLEFSLTGQNLLRPRTFEFGDSSVAGTQAERSVFGQITWRF
jgi:iron complex outermembrane receptor protein